MKYVFQMKQMFRQVNRTANPLVFDLDNDAGEKYQIVKGHKFNEAVELIAPYLEEHRRTMVKGNVFN